MIVDNDANQACDCYDHVNSYYKSNKDENPLVANRIVFNISNIFINSLERISGQSSDMIQ